MVLGSEDTKDDNCNIYSTLPLITEVPVPNKDLK